MAKHPNSSHKRGPLTAYTGEAASQYDEVRFATPHGLAIDGLEREAFNRATRRLDKNSRVLEVGCGTSRWAILLAEHGHGVTAIDPSDDMIRVSRSKSAFTNLDLAIAEGIRLPFSPDTFDFVFAIRVLNQVDSAQYAEETITEMVRVTRPGGLVLVEFVNRKRPFARPTRGVKLSFERVRKILTRARADIVEERGAFILSMTLLQSVPPMFLRMLTALDRRLAGLPLGKFGSRGYTLARKAAL